MKAIDCPFMKIINGTSQFVIPVFQRDSAPKTNIPRPVPNAWTARLVPEIVESLFSL